MPSLNLRNIDVTLVTSLRTKAASLGVTLRGYCISALEDSLADIRGTGSIERGPEKRSGNSGTMPVLPQAKSRKKQLHPLQSVRSELASRGNGPAQLSQQEPGSGKIGSCPHVKGRTEAYCRILGGGC